MREKAQIGKDGVSVLGIAEAAEAMGFKTVGVRVRLEKLVAEAPLPCILHWGQNHFMLLYRESRGLNRQPISEAGQSVPSQLK